MSKTFARAWKIFHGGERGITGLETAIILIAFVTVASVLAYSVLSAGIFSAERGKETVYRGLNQAQSSMQVRGSVFATDNDTTPDGDIDQIMFTIASVLGDEGVDMTDNPAGGSSGNSVVINYSDNEINVQDINWTKTLLGSERGGPDMLDPDEAMLITVDVPGGADINAYDTFTLQVIPTKGAAITIKRTLPGSVLAMNDLH
jgi:flagellin FlaB